MSKQSEELPESTFIMKFKELKKQRNNHLIDEPDFDERVEQLAADTYAHPTAEGYCCACEYDIAYLDHHISKAVIEALTIVSKEANNKMYKNGMEDFVEAMIAELKAKQDLSNE